MIFRATLNKSQVIALTFLKDSYNAGNFLCEATELVGSFVFDGESKTVYHLTVTGEEQETYLQLMQEDEYKDFIRSLHAMDQYELYAIIDSLEEWTHGELTDVFVYGEDN